MRAHTGPISGVAAGPGGWMATAGYDNRLLLWRDGRPVARGWHDHLVNQCAFDPEGARLVSAGSDHLARIWRLPDLRLEAVLGDHEDDVEMAAFDPAGARVATASRDGIVRIFRRDGALLARLCGHAADVISVTWSADGAEVISSSDDGTVRRWDAAEGTLRHTLDLGGETDTVVVAPDGTVYAGDDAGDLVVLPGDGGPVRRVRAHGAGIKRLVLDPRGERLLSTSYDRSLAIWRLGPEGPALAARTAVPAVVWARSAAFGADGRAWLGSFGDACAIYDPAADRWHTEHIGPTPGLNAVARHGGATFAVGDAGVVYRDGAPVARLGSACNFLLAWGARLVAGGHLGAVFDVSASAAAGRPVVLHQHASPLNCAAALADGDLLVGSYTGEAVRLSARTGAATRVLGLHGQAIKGLAAAGAEVFSVSAAGEAARHRSDHDLGGAPGPERRGPDPGVERWPGAHSRIANGVCALPDGRFASVSRDRQLRLFGPEGVETLPSPHTHSVKCVTLAAGGRWIFTGAYDGTVAAWDRERGRWAPPVRATTAGISSLCAGAEPHEVLASSYDGCLYRLTPGAAARRLHGGEG